VIVFDASTIVSAALKPGSPPERALLHAYATDLIALSLPVEAEIVEVLQRPRFRGLTAARRDRVLTLLRDAAIWFDPLISVSDCRDAKDNKVLELALAAAAGVIVTGDNDLLILDPWRGVRILPSADYLAIAASPG